MKKNEQFDYLSIFHLVQNLMSIEAVKIDVRNSHLNATIFVLTKDVNKFLI